MTGPMLLLVALIVFCGSVGRGFTGFGAVLFTLPFLALCMPLKEAVPLLAALGLANGIWLAWRARRQVEGRECLLLLLGGVPGVAAGLVLFHGAPDEALRSLLGIPVALLGLWLARGAALPRQPWPEWLAGGAGLLGGVMGGLYGLSGPAPVFYLAGRPLAHERFRATLLMYITVLDVLLGGGFTATGALTGPLWLLGLGLLPVSVAGSWLGEHLQQRVPDKTFRRYTGAALVLMGVVLGVWR